MMPQRLRDRPGATGFVCGAIAGAVLAGAAGFLTIANRSSDMESGELVILSGKDDSAGRQRHVLIEQWNATHPSNQARMVEISSIADAQHTEMVADAQSRDNQVDIYNLDITWIAEFAREGYIREIDDSHLDLRPFLDNPIRTCRYDGRLWALPFNTDAGLLFYRSDLVTKAPITWDQLTDLTREVITTSPRSGNGQATTTNGTQIPQAGYVGQLGEYEGRTVNAFEAIIAAGGEVVDDHNAVVIDSEAARTGLRRLAEGLAEAAPQIILPESFKTDETGSTKAFASGQTLFMRNWPVAYRELQRVQDDPTAGKQSRVTFGVSLLPGGNVLGGQDLAISKKSKKPRAAQKLIEFLTDARSQQILFERGGFAATRDIVYKDSEIRRIYPYAPLLAVAVARAKPRPQLRYYTLFSDVFQQVVAETIEAHGTLPPNAVSRLSDAIRGFQR